jgi:hypothetical protein
LDALTSLLTNIRKLSEIPIDASVQKLYTKSNRKEAEKEREKALLEINDDSLESEDLVETDDIAEETILTNDAAGVAVAEGAVDVVVAARAAEVVVTAGAVVQRPQGNIKRVRKGDVIDYLEKKSKVKLYFK